MFFLRRTAIAVVVAVCFGIASRADAVILYRSAIRNKSAPTGTNANSGWQWQGNWAGGFTGTPIASQYFLTAGHVGGGVGQNLWIDGKNHKTTAVWDDPSTDLRIFKIADKFSSWAPIYTGSTETNKRAMVFGRGTGRGAEVKEGSVLHGWKWATQDMVRSWGENNVAGSLDGGTGNGQLLKFTFSKNGLTNEGALSGGDSAGGVFINDGGKWKLAGINYLVDGPFSLSSGGATFQASIYDKGGLYVQNQLIPDSSTDVPGQWYATRVSSRQSWIKSIIGSTSSASVSPAALSGTSAVPEPGTLSLVGIGAAWLLGRRRRRLT
jgi:hypothetical protein